MGTIRSERRTLGVRRACVETSSNKRPHKYLEIVRSPGPSTRREFCEYVRIAEFSARYGVSAPAMAAALSGNGDGGDDEASSGGEAEEGGHMH